MDDVQFRPVSREVTPGQRVRVALVGAGLVGQAGHAITLAEERDRFDFAAVVDPSQTVRAAVAARHGVPRTAGRLDDLPSADLDAVVVAVPDPAHRDVVVGALRAGLHVFCEKPIATTLQEADDMIAARGDRVLQCGYMKLYDPAVERLVELLSQRPSDLVYLSIEVNDPDQAPFVGHLGLVVGHDVPAELIEQTRRRGAQAVDQALGRAATPSEARAFEAYLGALVHDVSLAHHLLAALGVAAPLPLTGAAYFDAGRGVSLSWRLPGGAHAHLTHLNLPGVADYRERVTVYCRDSIWELTFPSPYLRHLPTRLVERRTTPDWSGGASPGTTAIGLTTTDHRVSYEEAFRTELRAFHASITQGAPVRAGAEAAREDLRALLSALRLAATGGPEPQKEATR
jgi:predicted dehydrogenase